LLVRPTSVFIAAVLWGSRILITAPVVFSLLNRLIRRSMADLLQEIWAPLFGTGIMAAVLLILRSHNFMVLSPIETLLVEIPLGAVVYGAVIALVKRDSLRRLIVFVINGIRGRAASPET
jgi:hypothetical protein